MKNKLIIACLLLAGCSGQQKLSQHQASLNKQIDQSFETALVQYKGMRARLGPDRFPKTYYKSEDRFQSATSSDWCSGFYPGTLAYLYEFSGDTAIRSEMERILPVLEKEKNNKGTHDLGFMMYCSFGNAERVAPRPEYQAILLQSARSLATRYNPTVGCIKSWDRVKSWDGKTIWSYPVIIDNMINLELLFYASRVTGDSSFRQMAISHADHTMRNHLRSDYSSYHVVNYDPASGAVVSKETHQGFSDYSTWSRGQAWGVYGFTMVYRETKDVRFLKTAIHMADYFLDHLPADRVPDWDFNVGQPGYTPLWKYDASRFTRIPKDASAAAVVASALIELSGYVPEAKSKLYMSEAEAIIKSLSSEAYMAKPGENGNFLLMHSTGGVPSYAEIDVPLTYADYYFVEALHRYQAKQMKKNSTKP